MAGIFTLPLIFLREIAVSKGVEAEAVKLPVERTISCLPFMVWSKVPVAP